jgi:2,4-dienoyl-CoA reductase-like NADH-dependent reductase (Old Yellow Enzyme family)/thioredoxin reductase
MNRYDNLFSPITIGTMELSNRVVMPPMGTLLGNPDGTVSDEVIAYLKRRAEGGPGLIMTEIVGVHPNGLSINSQLSAFDDRFIPGLKRLVDVAHERDIKIAMQIHHAGRESFFMLAEGKAIGPSAIPSLIYGMPPREMTEEDIGEIITAFGSAARRGREAGFDAVEVHGAHGYLLTQFLSELSNQRTDGYGGSMKNRARFITEILAEVRKEVGKDFPLSLRLSVDECIKGGYTARDIAPILPDFVRAGVDMIHASFGTHGSPGGITSAPIEYEPGFNAWLAREVKEAVNVPVIAVGRFTEPALADEVIARGDADLVAFGRQFLADPDFLTKAKEGRSGDICTCIACNQGCIERLMLGEGKIRCAINPETGQETIYPQGPAAKPRTVWVIGAGPGGLTAAHEAARLGHNVTLFEEKGETGGLVRIGSKAPFKKAYGEWIEWLTREAEKKGVTIITNATVSDEMIREKRPERVILATGGTPIVPDIPGIDLENVRDALEILAGNEKPGNNVVIVGGGQTGMEVADFAASRGSSVTIVEMLKRSPVMKLTSHGYMLHRRVRESRCTLLLNTTVKKIEKNLVVIESEGEERILSPVDQVIVAAGIEPCDVLTKTLEEENIPYFIIGDAKKPRRIMEATDEGAQAAWNC